MHKRSQYFFTLQMLNVEPVLSIAFSLCKLDKCYIIIDHFSEGLATTAGYHLQVMEICVRSGCGTFVVHYIYIHHQQTVMPLLMLSEVAICYFCNIDQVHESAVP